LQVALSAQLCKTNYDHLGAAAQDCTLQCTGPKKNGESRFPKSGSSDIAKLRQVVFNLKVKMGTMRKAMTRACILFDKSPNEQKPREQLANGKQKEKIVGTV
jgi:hypothetical protein